MMRALKCKKLILGGGIAGLATQFLVRNSSIISQEFGGQSMTEMPLGPRILKYDEYTKSLFNQLGLLTKTRKYKIGYVMDGIVHNKLFEEFKKRYVEHTREINTVENTFLSSSENTITALDLNYSFFINILKHSIPVSAMITGKLIEINLQDKFVKYEHANSHEVVEYEKLISTIPLPIFYKLSKQFDKITGFEAFDTSFIRVISDEKFDKELAKKFDYVYVVDEQMFTPYLFHRLTFTDEKTKYDDVIYIAECKGSFNDDDMRIYHRYNSKQERIVIPYQTIKNCQIKKSKKIRTDEFGTMFVGRYAEWDHSIKINEVLKRVMDYITLCT